MKCNECLAVIARLDETSPASLPEVVRAHLAGCPACRERFEALRLLEEGTGLRVTPPQGLAESVLARCNAAPRQRHALRWAPLAVAALLAIAVALPLARWGDGGPAREATAGLVRIHLVLEAPQALAVTVVGDWNEWNPNAQPMKRQDGKWEIDLELQRGRFYQYQFLVDGDRWIPDPRCLAKVDNGFGGMNSLLGS